MDSPSAVVAVLLFSADPESLTRFYREQLGVPLRFIEVAGLEQHFACDIGHVYFSIWPAGAQQSPSGSGKRAGTAFYVEDLPATFERLAASGVPVEFAPRRTPLGVIARLRDPDGNIFELYHP